MHGLTTNFTFFIIYFVSVFCNDDQIFTVYRLIPQNKIQLEFLKNLVFKDHELELDFWTEPSKHGRPVDIMVGQKYKTTLLENILSIGLNFTILVENVEQLIKEREHKRWHKIVLRDDAANGKANNENGYDIFRYKSYDEMVRYMEYLSRRNPTIAQVMNLGHTFQGRIIKFMKIGSPLNDTNKRAIWIDAGIHAREWVSQATAMYFIHTLISEYRTDRNVTNYVDGFTWYIVPNLNPDGYEYSRSSTKPQVRGWRKNRSLRTGCTHELCCSGVDLNRNFDVFWGHYGSSENRCSHVYHGEMAFSELETQAVRNFIKIHRQEIDAFITLHAHSQFWAFPYGYLTGYYPRDVKDLRTIAKRATKALQSLYGTVYKVGSSADLLGYAASGGSDDWAKSKMGIKFVYVVELRPEEHFETGYIYDEALLPQVATETWAGVKEVADAVQQMNEIIARRLQKYFQGAPPRRRTDSAARRS